MLSTQAEHAECLAGVHVGDRPLLPPKAIGASGPWPVLGRGSDKEGWALSGPTERALARPLRRPGAGVQPVMHSERWPDLPSANRLKS